MKNLLILGLVTIAALWFVLYGVGMVASTDPENQTQIESSESSPKSVQPDTNTLETTINQLINDNPDLALSIAITDLNTGKTYQYGDSASFIAASTTKLITAATVLNKIETGEFSLDSRINGMSVREQLKQLIEVSNNEVWANLKAYIGTTELDQYAQQIGLTTYDSATNTIASSDMALFLSQLYEGKILNASHTQLLLSHMEQADMNQYIPAAVPAGFTTYHKAGYLEDRLHDVAIIKDDDRTFVLVIFTKDAVPYDFVNGTTIMHEVTSAAINAFLLDKN